MSQLAPDCMQVFEQATMLVMLYQGAIGTSACCMPTNAVGSMLTREKAEPLPRSPGIGLN
jgi:hypothetical protein